MSADLLGFPDLLRNVQPSSTSRAVNASLDHEPVARALPPGLHIQSDFPPPIPSLKAGTTDVQHPTAKGVTVPIPTLQTLPAVPNVPQAQFRPVPPKHDIPTDKQVPVLKSIPSDTQNITTAMATDLAHPKDLSTAITTSKALGSTTKPTTLAKPLSNKTSARSEAGAQPERRGRPMLLDLTAAQEVIKQEIASIQEARARSDTSNQVDRSVSATQSRPSTPVTQVMPLASSATRQTRTIRMVQTPKTETLPKQPGTERVASASASKQASRRPSLASLNMPGTPISEFLSDNASVTTTSISRPGSPPSSKIGSAAVRQKSKSQQKKERQARAKVADLSDVLSPGTAEDAIQAPIVGRKKKSRKQQTQDDEEMAGGRAASPKIEEQPTTAPRTRASVKTAEEEDLSTETSTPTEPVKEYVEETTKETATAPSKLTPQNITAASIIAEMMSDGSYPMARGTDMLFHMSSINQRMDVNDQDLYGFRGNITPAQRTNLENGEAICIETEKDVYAIMAPDCTVLRNLTKVAAEQYLSLRTAVKGRSPPLSFYSDEHSIDRWLHSRADGLPLLKTFDKDPKTQTASEEILNDEFACEIMRDGWILGSQVYPTYEDFGAGHIDVNDFASRVPTMTLAEAESAMVAAKKETEALEKKLFALMKRNKKLFPN